ncbi:MAG: NAD(P)(+) transhydrogenase (Re/Si-specific) subunit beta [Candidatus Marinimicrobia bacterium]|jgi:NAD(P) transhydrogenase subunit beta|nr:NAD(P)(+) transhydrogenase (Re/Si-specific) subunit beta [Candidatus Neomarinimicrobiota bacterium]MBT3618360.1 NAD(P)(+) transhydrogenase (Re/Si-specific) subunit beta [Candidatus Neomarinimicrobiota bacterium]MBT3829155.1 NAD(P)(+) transhydrogenase (Re/Si-specific) subunit beta [Candidatus Neomarinimicrobiota bacterium]MBT3998123.1 NAD(P)(+) transhydrogenase (Re/Si-specific) subunit beta [Candidatus Neomarinimicrobiota bacterium]MBT4281464.1 NAD(P)(+) transhydrogenase (Re/Si-specific) subu
MLESVIIPLIYLASAVSFILGLKQLSHPRTAPKGNSTAAVGMLLAIIGTLFKTEVIDFQFIIIGLVVGSAIGVFAAKRVEMTSMPQLVALFNGFGGLSSLLVATSEVYSGNQLGTFTLSTVSLSILIGSITFSGSLVAFAKLQGIMRGMPLVFKGARIFNGLLILLVILLTVYTVMNPSELFTYILWIIALSLISGYYFVVPIGGADMPVVISLLNSFSGIAAASTGFVIANDALIISGALVGASGIILTNIMCKGMNRTLWNVLFIGIESSSASEVATGPQKSAKSYEPEDTVVIFENAKQVVIVPGYGMAVAQAQHVVHEFQKTLEAKGVTVKYAVHPVAGRMPGHMNVLLAEANVSYDNLYDLDAINPEFEETDIALVIGANDVVNPAARHDTASPIFGMPILDVDKAQTVFVLKRSMNPGYAGIENELFFNDNTIMIFGDAKETVGRLTAELR